ncbi:MAG: exonuclease SbcCD subunit D [Bacillota bacterium]|nr:exonuclease SbcCD subunit D [Bacillota bacterium]
MKLIHLSDLHLGKRLREYSLLEDQEYILAEILNIIDGEKPDGVIIAGDIYDKAVPSAEAVRLFDEFVFRLSKRGLKVFVISGNHDSAERVAYLGRVVENAGVYFSPVYSGEILPVQLEDEFGGVNVYLLPFIKPAQVKHFFPQEEIKSYTDAVSCAVKHMNIDTAQRNVLVTHQFITNSVTCESEEVSVGGADNVDASAVAEFDYVALGHLHVPQSCGNEHIRYCGTPLKYSFSEAKVSKSVTVVELGEKGSVSVRTIPLVPKRDMVDIRGSFEEIMQKEFYEGTSWQEDYVRITLTDEETVADAYSRLRCIYRKLMLIQYDNKRTRTRQCITTAENVRQKSELELFAELFEKQNNMPMSDEQLEYMQRIIAEIKEVQA